MPATQVTRCARPGRRGSTTIRSPGPVMDLLRRVLRLRDVAELSVVKADFRLELRGGASCGVPSP